MDAPTRTASPPIDGVPPLPGMRVSVLVPTFNRANYLPECLDSLLLQTMPALEIIVIDDGSQDNTAEVIERYGQRVRYVRKDNGGKPTAVNLGLSLAQGELIWIFDDDDVALPHAIASRVTALRLNPDAGFVYGPHYYGSDGPDGMIRQGRLHRLSAHDPQSFLLELMKGCFFHLATALVRAQAYRTVGDFDTELLSSEDYDMQLRLTRSFTAAYCPEPIFIFRQHTGPRGAMAIRYAGAQRTNVFRRFDQRVGRKLRTGLALGDYLVPRLAQVGAPATQRQALLNRMTVMASKGCLPEMMEDLCQALSLLPSDGVPTAAEQHTITTAICTGYAPDAITDQWDDFRLLLAGLPRSPAGRAAIRSITAGFIRLAKGYPGPLAARWRRLTQAALVAVRSINNSSHTP